MGQPINPHDRGKGSTMKTSHHIIEHHQTINKEKYTYAIHIEHREPVSGGNYWEGFYWVIASTPSEVIDRWEVHGLKMTSKEIAEVFNR
tara:strand:+ start:289 stop:555 length:267 start_codon:yes stop_codon:yes gene_type:complete